MPTMCLQLKNRIGYLRGHERKSTIPVAPRAVAKNILLTLFCFFFLYFFHLSFKPTSPCKNSIRYIGMDKTIIKLF